MRNSSTTDGTRKFRRVGESTFGHCTRLRGTWRAHHLGQHQRAAGVHGLIAGNTSHLDNVGYSRGSLLCQWNSQRWRKGCAWKYNIRNSRSLRVLEWHSENTIWLLSIDSVRDSSIIRLGFSRWVIVNTKSKQILGHMLKWRSRWA